VADNVRKLCAEGGVDSGGEGRLELSSERNIRKSDAFRCEVCAGSKVLFDDCKSGSQPVLENGVDLEGCLSRKPRERMVTHRFVVGVDGALDELEDKGVVTGNVGVHERNPLVD